MSDTATLDPDHDLLLASNHDIATGHSESLGENNVLLPANSPSLKSNAEILKGNHDLLLLIAVRLGVA